MRTHVHSLARRLLWVAASLTLAGLLYGISGNVAALPQSPPSQELACLRGETTWLRGQSEPGTGLLAYFAEQPVGGGVAGPDGSWAIPIAVQDAPGIYPVTVVNRHAVGVAVASFICYVDIPVGSVPTATPAAQPATAEAPVEPSSPPVAADNEALSATATTPADELAASPTSDPLLPTSTEATATPTEAGLTPTEAGLTPTLEPTPTAPSEVSPTLEPTSTAGVPPAGGSELDLVSVQPHTPGEPELFEYVIIENLGAAAQDITGWRLVHGTTGEAFSIPAFSLPAANVLAIWSGSGEDDPEGGTLYWPAEAGRWAAGDTIELRGADGQLRDTLVVPAAESD